MKYSNAVQVVRGAYIEVDFSELPSGSATPIGINLPVGAVILDGSILVLTASDAVTSEALTLGTAASASKYGSVANSKSAGRTAVTPSAAPTAGAEVLTLTRTAVGAQTKGAYGVAVSYALAGASGMGSQQ